MKKSKIDYKKWSKGNLLYMPAEDELWEVRVVHGDMALVRYQNRKSAVVLLAGPGEVAPERNTVLVGRV